MQNRKITQKQMNLAETTAMLHITEDKYKYRLYLHGRDNFREKDFRRQKLFMPDIQYVSVL